MNNKKRAFMVPVMTLAVCAIAMVGLGFAINTSVTSNSNTVEKLMIDLDKDYNDLKGQTDPDESDVNKLFNIGVGTSKKTSAATYSNNKWSATIDGITITTTVGSVSEGTITGSTIKVGEGEEVSATSQTVIDNLYIISYTNNNETYTTVVNPTSSPTATTSKVTSTLTSSYAYIKIFGNVNLTSLKVKNESTTAIGLSLFEATVDNSGKITEFNNTAISSATASSGSEGTFSNPGSIHGNTIYLIAITSIGGENGYKISYTLNSSNNVLKPAITGTCNISSGLNFNLEFTATGGSS